jgi:transcriptional regulator with XRE-family HTH domain
MAQHKQSVLAAPKRVRRASVVIAFGRRLKELRLGRGLSQSELASHAGIHWSYVGRLERGRAAPGLDLLARLASALGISLSELLPSQQMQPLPHLRRQARRRFKSVLSRADAASLGVLIPILALLDDSLAR